MVAKLGGTLTRTNADGASVTVRFSLP